MRKQLGNPNPAGKRVTQEPLLISFSGLDGSGKSTQIESLYAALRAAGLASRRLTFWDDVVVGARFREGFVHTVYKSERGIGTPGKPVNRRDKNMRGWHLTLFRHLLYLLDAVNLRRVIRREQKAARQANLDVILLDRYIYDELANLNLKNPLSRIFVRLVRSFTPRPDVAYLLDADPAAARARKPEYSVEFMMQCRESYLKLAGLLRTITVIPALNLSEARLAVLKRAEQSLSDSGCPVSLVSGKVSAA
jgi:thymidylate kinase